MRKPLERIANFIQGSPLLEFMFGFAIVFSFIWLSYGAYTVVQDVYVRFQPASSFFEWRSVKFVGATDNGLIFSSERAIYRSAPITWNDILFCENGETYSFFSSQETSNINPEIELETRTLEWNYNSPIPKDKDCYLEANITMDVRGHEKRQTLTTGVFRIE